MTAHTNTLSASQRKNIETIVYHLLYKGVTNLFTQAAILAVVSKESNYNPSASEVSYATTPNERIRKIFSKTVPLGDAYLTELKKNPKNFFDFVYNGVAGNGVNDGYNYRGRGFNQLTGKANYASIGKLIGVDLVAKPYLLAEPKIAAEALLAYFQNGIKTLAALGKLKQHYNATNINDFKTLKDALGAIYHINAGPGQSQAHIIADVTGGYAKSKKVVGDLYELVKQNQGVTGGGAFFLLLMALAIWKRKEISTIGKKLLSKNTK